MRETKRGGMKKAGKPKRRLLVRETSPEYGHPPVKRPVYDLENRTEGFARDVRQFVRRLPRTAGNIEDVPQLVRASGSVAANYIEANESVSPKDFILRIKYARKEAKEARLWLRLVDVGMDETTAAECRRMVQEATEIMNIMGAIYRKSL